MAVCTISTSSRIKWLRNMELSVLKRLQSRRRSPICNLRKHRKQRKSRKISSRRLFQIHHSRLYLNSESGRIRMACVVLQRLVLKNLFHLKSSYGKKPKKSRVESTKNSSSQRGNEHLHNDHMFACVSSAVSHAIWC